MNQKTMNDVPAGDVVSSVYTTLARNEMSVVMIELRGGRRGEALVVRCRTRTREGILRALGDIRALPGVDAVRADLRGISDRATPHI